MNGTIGGVHGTAASSSAHGTASAGPLVRVEELTMRFAQRGKVVHAVEGVSLAIEGGGAMALVGESGCGKTTLARALLRLVEPTAGRVVIGGIEVTGLGAGPLRRFRRRAQIVFQDSLAALDPRLTVRAALAEPLALHGVVPRAAIGGEVERLLARVGLDRALASRRPHELSGGQRQRVAIARALSLRPGFLVADEPLAELDASLRAQVINLLADLRAEEHLTLLLISHDLAAARQLCDRIAVMYLGRIVEEAPARALFAASRHPYTRALLAAAPAVFPSPRAARPRLEGEPPSAITPPPGCAFHPRCPLYAARGRPPICVQERPLLDGGPGEAHRAACHFAGET